MGEFEDRVRGLAVGVPIALLPVRLEARFFGTELRVRIFPDQIHLDSHETALTAAERDAGTAYWRERFAAPDPATRERSPWTALCTAVGPGRAAWVVRALTPVNLNRLGQPVQPEFPPTASRPAEWSAAARAVALPERWAVIGLRGGVEVCRKWTTVVADRLDVTPAPDVTTAPADPESVLQDSARWLVDFDAAERAGMAVRITAAEVNGRLSLGFDRLVALGVDWTLTPRAAAESIGRLLAAHLYTDGVSTIAPGTPTNVTATARPGAAPTDAALAAALDPERPATNTAGTGADRLWHALGVAAGPADPLAAVPDPAGHAQAVASNLADALWESTLGSYLTDALTPLFPDTRTADLRRHVRDHLFPGGPFPALRIGRQPYGVLPVVAYDRQPVTAEPFEMGLLSVLPKLRLFWEQGLANVPRLGRSTDLDADLASLLQTTPLAAAVRFRTVLGPLTVSSTRGLDRHAVAQQYITSMVGVYLGIPPPTAANEFGVHPGHERLTAPLVDAAAPGRLAELAGIARTSGSYDALKAREDTAGTLVEAMAVHAVARELHRADLRTIDRYRLASGQLAALPDVGVLPLSEYVGIEAVPAPAPGSVLVTTQSQASRVMIPSVTGTRTVREFVTTAVAGGSTTPDHAPLQATLRSLDFLATCSPDDLDRAVRGLLDVYGHRLDAWYTSLATRRLAAARSATPTGVHLGGYGWLDDLRPAAGTNPNHGFIHAPSLGQATTAAVLRSGHLAHHGADHEALSVDLTSGRVRTAMALLDGVAQGQPLPALLGYRFERAVRAHGFVLAQYILPIRRLAPLRPTDAPAGQPTPSDHLATRDVVDGVALLERWRTEGPALFDALQQLVAWPPPPAEVFVMPPQSERNLLAVELDRLADLYDAVSDVLVAEAVHQNVLGNNERAAAALAALDRQGQPPRLEFPRTPRSGTSYTQRLLVLVGDETFPPSWPAPVLDPRARAEPRLNAWVARILGDPRRIRFAATTPNTTSQLRLTFDQLGLSPLAAVLAAGRPGRDAPSELEDRLLHLFDAMLPVGTPASIRPTLVAAAPRGTNPGTIGLAAFQALSRWITALVTTQRPATARDLALPQDDVDEGLDDTELRARADALMAVYRSTVDTLDRVSGDAASTDQQVRDALWTAAALGVDRSVPPPPRSGHDDLVARAREVAATMTAAAGRERDLTGDGDTPRLRVEHQTRRIRALLGEQFPVLPRFTVANAAALTASLAARTTLLGGDELAPGVWLHRMALVRTGVDRLARVRGAAELVRSTDVTPRDLTVLHLPHTPGERWLALPSATPAQAEVAVVAHTSGAVNFGAALAGLACDAWPEVIPGREETTGLALHHDAPGARAPQAVLLAVPPVGTAPSWTVETILRTLVEAHDLARIRAVGPDTLPWLGTVLPASLLPDSNSSDTPTVSLMKLNARSA